MREIKSGDVKEGMKIAEDIYSKLGGIIYRKGQILQIRDKEILRAFGVPILKVEEDENIRKEIDIEKTKESLNEGNESKITTRDGYNYNKEFKEIAIYIDNLLKSARGNVDISVFELRNKIGPLLEKVEKNPKRLLTLNNFTTKINDYHSYHSLYVGLMSYSLAKWVGLEQSEWMQIALAGVLHDIGMERVPNEIISSKNRLSFHEINEVRKHTIYGYESLKETIGLNKNALLAVLQHHERLDGSGYPLKLKKEQIHNYSKIIAITDVFHAMVSRRSYRMEHSVFNVLSFLLEEGKMKLEYKYVQTFVQKLSQITIGENVILNNGQQGTVIFVDDKMPTKPWVKVDDKIINLTKENTLYIKNINI